MNTQPNTPASRNEEDAARWRRLVNASEASFPVASIANDPENDARMIYGRKRLEQFIDGLDEISDQYALAAPGAAIDAREQLTDEQLDAALPADVQRSARGHQKRWRAYARTVLALSTAKSGEHGATDGGAGE